jgi:hypothetical protein
MTIRVLADVIGAYNAGQVHTQRFLKNAGSSHNVNWADPTFSSGQPPYDAHVGSPLAFTPCVAVKNDSVYFPSILSTQERYLHTVTIWSNQSQFNGPGSVFLYDLVGYYPLIDGDSTDQQLMDNTLALPRYTDGKGLIAVWVNHVSPPIQNGVAQVNLTDSNGVESTVTISVPNVGSNMVCSGLTSTSGSANGGFAMPIGTNASGLRSINWVQYSTPPSGLHCIYLIKPLGTVVMGDNMVAVEKDFFLSDGFRMPRVLDGAWLGWFDNLGAGTSRSVNWFGNFTFIWA